MCTKNTCWHRCVVCREVVCWICGCCFQALTCTKAHCKCDKEKREPKQEQKNDIACKELPRFIQISASGEGMSHHLYALGEDGKVYEYHKVRTISQWRLL